MSISYDRKKINKILLLLVIFVLAPLLSFGIIEVATAVREKNPIIVFLPERTIESTTKDKKSDKTEVSEGLAAVVASKKGDKYHLLDCPGAKTILPENKIFFTSTAEAEKAGYSRAKNCKGLNTEPK